MTAPPRVTETGRASGIADTAHGRAHVRTNWRRESYLHHHQHQRHIARDQGHVSTARDSGSMFTTESTAKGARAGNLVHGARRAFTVAALGRRLRHLRHRLCHRRRQLRHRRGSMVTAKLTTGSAAKGASAGDLPLAGLRVSRRASAAAALGRHCPRRDCLRRRRRRCYLRGSVTALDLRRLTQLASSRR